jgi:surface carbohydrate biosynthesis protein (TIGR04326 family)
MPISAHDKLSNAEVVVWDSPDQPKADTNITLLWRSYGYENQPNQISIPKLIEESAKRHKTIFLSWIYDLGELPHHGKKVVQHLEIESGFSYWWLTRFSEKCNIYKSPQVETAIKLIAFDELLNNKKIKTVKLFTVNKNLAKCIESWCSDRNIRFVLDTNQEPIKKNKKTLYNWFEKLILAATAIVWLMHYAVTRLQLRNVGVRKWKTSKNKLTFVSYSANMVSESINEGVYESNYWTKLPQTIIENNVNSNWLHIFSKDSTIKNARSAAKVMRRFNNIVGDVHTTVDSFLTIRIVFKTLFNWINLIVKSSGLSKVISQHKCNSVNLWPIMKEEWNRSIFGRDALKNLLFMNLFDRALAMLPEQKTGVYLQENQGWEISMLSAWRRSKHGDIYGFPHSTIRDWDLRYFFDSRIYISKDILNLPMPTKIATNGLEIRDKLIMSGIPSEKLIEVESLRHLHLETINLKLQEPKNDEISFKLLVLGGYLSLNTHRQISMLNESICQLTKEIKIVIKPHPLRDINVSKYKNLSASLATDSIEKLLMDCDAVYTDCETSSSVDAYCAGVPVISELNPESLNLSPLRDRKGVLFVSNSKELATAIQSIIECTSYDSDCRDFFYIDSDLPRWKELLIEKVKQ